MEQMTAPGAAAAAPANDMNFFARWANIYFSPKKTFEAVRQRPFWLLPMGLLILLAIGFHFWTARPSLSDAKDALKKNKWIMEKMSDEDRQKMLGDVEKGFQPVRLILSHSIRLLIYYFAVSAIFLFIGNILMGGEARYPQLIGVFVYADFISVPEMLVEGFLGNAKGTMQSALSLAAFFPADKTGTFAYNFINSFDIFSIWFITVLIIGMATVYNFKTSKVAMVILPVWLLWKVVMAVLTGFGFAM